jgi:hypothetical protein
MNLSHVDVFSVLSMISGLAGTGALSTFGDSIDALAPGYGRKAVALVSILSFGAGLVLRTHTSNTNVAAGTNTPAA